MSENPAIHRHPSGDIDIALPSGEPETSTESTDNISDGAPPDSKQGQPG